MKSPTLTGTNRSTILSPYFMNSNNTPLTLGRTAATRSMTGQGVPASHRKNNNKAAHTRTPYSRSQHLSSAQRLKPSASKHRQLTRQDTDRSAWTSTVSRLFSSLADPIKSFFGFGLEEELQEESVNDVNHSNVESNQEETFPESSQEEQDDAMMEESRGAQKSRLLKKKKQEEGVFKLPRKPDQGSVFISRSSAVKADRHSRAIAMRGGLGTPLIRPSLDDEDYEQALAHVGALPLPHHQAAIEYHPVDSATQDGYAAGLSDSHMDSAAAFGMAGKKRAMETEDEGYEEQNQNERWAIRRPPSGMAAPSPVVMSNSPFRMSLNRPRPSSRTSQGSSAAGRPGLKYQQRHLAPTTKLIYKPPPTLLVQEPHMKKKIRWIDDDCAEDTLKWIQNAEYKAQLAASQEAAKRALQEFQPSSIVSEKLISPPRQPMEKNETAYSKVPLASSSDVGCQMSAKKSPGRRFGLSDDEEVVQNEKPNVCTESIAIQTGSDVEFVVDIVKKEAKTPKKTSDFEVQVDLKSETKKRSAPSDESAQQLALSHQTATNVTPPPSAKIEIDVGGTFPFGSPRKSTFVREKTDADSGSKPSFHFPALPPANTLSTKESQEDQKVAFTFGASQPAAVLKPEASPSSAAVSDSFKSAPQNPGFSFGTSVFQPAPVVTVTPATPSLTSPAVGFAFGAPPALAAIESNEGGDRTPAQKGSLLAEKKTPPSSLNAPGSDEMLISPYRGPKRSFEAQPSAHTEQPLSNDSGHMSTNSSGAHISATAEPPKSTSAAPSALFSAPTTTTSSFSFGAAPVETKPVAATTALTFGVAQSSSGTPSLSSTSVPSFSFGATSSSTTTTTAPSVPSATPTFTFGAPNPSSATANVAAAVPSTGTTSFSFGTSSSSVTAPTTAGSGFQPFGQTKEATSSNATSFQFGNNSTTAPSASGSFTFEGTQPSGPSQAPQVSNNFSSTTATGQSSFTFGAAAPSTAAASSSPNVVGGGFSFGASSTEQNSTTPSSSFTFGNNSNTTATTGNSAPGFSFGMNNTSANDSTSSFGNMAGATPSFSFGGSNPQPTAPASNGFAFQFGGPQQASASPAVTPSSGFSFGAPNAGSTGAAPFAFGQQQQQPVEVAAANAQPAFNMGVSSTAPVGNRKIAAMRSRRRK